MKVKSEVLNDAAVNRALIRIAHEIAERNENIENLIFAGIQTRGVPLAERLSCIIRDKIDPNSKIPVGELDITYYRDDLTEKRKGAPIVSKSLLPENIEGKTIILVDDVIFTGRTVRAALDALIRIARPACIQLAVLVDRGHREVPIRPDYVGKNIPTSRNEIIRVNLTETDGTEGVDICENR